MTTDQLLALQPGDSVRYTCTAFTPDGSPDGRLLRIVDPGSGHLIRRQAGVDSIDCVTAIDPADPVGWTYCCRAEDIEMTARH